MNKLLGDDAAARFGTPPPPPIFFKLRLILQRATFFICAKRGRIFLSHNRRGNVGGCLENPFELMRRKPTPYRNE
ncbi:MAG: hypothetical protein LBK73_14190 [Treponema sp.]|nr:hypothetical protein [Treponema sp.]